MITLNYDEAKNHSDDFVVLAYEVNGGYGGMLTGLNMILRIAGSCQKKNQN